jgi:hypothetical protein
MKYNLLIYQNVTGKAFNPLLAATSPLCDTYPPGGASVEE